MKTHMMSLTFILVLAGNTSAFAAKDALSTPSSGTICVGMNWGFGGYGSAYIVNCNKAFTQNNRNTFGYVGGIFTGAEQERKEGIIILQNAGYVTAELNVLRAKERHLHEHIDLVVSADLASTADVQKYDICVTDSDSKNTLGGVYACSLNAPLTLVDGRADLEGAGYVKLTTLVNVAGPKMQSVFVRAK